MSWLIRLVAGLLVISLTTTISLFITNQTILNTNYLTKQATKDNTYGQLSSELSQQLAKDAGNLNNPELTSKINQAISTPELTTSINQALASIIAFYKGQNTGPVINLSSQAQNLQSLGLPQSDLNTLSQPINLSGSSKLKSVGANFDTFKNLSLIITIVLLVVLVILCIQQRSYSALPHVDMAVGILLGLIGLVLYLLPKIANHFIKVNSSTLSFASTLDNLASSLAKSISEVYLIIGVILFVVGVIGKILVVKLRSKPTPVQAPVASPAPVEAK